MSQALTLAKINLTTMTASQVRPRAKFSRLANCDRDHDRGVAKVDACDRDWEPVNFFVNRVRALREISGTKGKVLN